MKRALIALLLCACASGKPPPVRPPHPLPPPAVMRAHFIDVGQGDSTLLEFPCGAALIDTGGEKNGGFDSTVALRDYLDKFFARRPDLKNTLDLLVITHPHIDHTRGVPMVLERYTVKNVIDDGLVRSSGKAEVALLHEWLAAHPEVHHRDILLDDIKSKEGLTDDVIDPIRCPDVDPQFHALWGQVEGDPGWPDTQWGKPSENENNHSVVLRVDFGRASFLFTGDLEEAAISNLVAHYRGTPVLDVDVYKVGHHGSRNGTTESLLRAMTPRIAVMSMGSPLRHWEWTAWEYGHPGAIAVDLLENFVKERRPETEVMVGLRKEEFTSRRIHGAEYGTGWDGTVVIEATSRGRYHVTTQLGQPKEGSVTTQGN